MENITDRFWLLARYPYMGRRRDDDLRPGLRSLSADNYVIIHSIAEDDVVLILHVVHGSRDLVRSSDIDRDRHPKSLCAPVIMCGYTRRTGRETTFLKELQ